MDINTHRKIDQQLCGKPLMLKEGFSRVELICDRRMTVDDRSLVHGGFIFGLADHAAMIAVNHPYVVLGSADSRFLKPVTAGDTVVAEAAVKAIDGKKYTVEAIVRSGEERVFAATFICFALDSHVLDR